jgi:hypothetical protein
MHTYKSIIIRVFLSRDSHLPSKIESSVASFLFLEGDINDKSQTVSFHHTFM